MPSRFAISFVAEALVRAMLLEEILYIKTQLETVLIIISIKYHRKRKPLDIEE